MSHQVGLVSREVTVSEVPKVGRLCVDPVHIQVKENSEPYVAH